MAATRFRDASYRVQPQLLGILNSVPKFTSALINTQKCADSVHKGPPYYTGGNLLIEKLIYRDKQISKSISVSKTSVPTQAYDGHFRVPAYQFSPKPAPTNLVPWGSIGWNRALPVRDVGGVARFLGELREAPAMIIHTRDFLKQFWLQPKYKDFSRSDWANAYLEAQFGWAPVIKDLLGFLTLGEKVDKAMRYLVKNNQKPIRKEFDLYNAEESYDLGHTSDDFGYLRPLLTTQLYKSFNGACHDFRLRVKKRIWFSSKWIFYFSKEELNTPAFRNNLRNQLSGVIPDMLTIYQLIPWTWLIDWFTGMGRVVANLALSAKYRQVARYAYVMCEESHTVVTTASQYVRYGTHSSSSSLPYTMVQAVGETELTYKQRAAASPYGFGIAWELFTPYQLSILVALGIGRT